MQHGGPERKQVAWLSLWPPPSSASERLLGREHSRCLQARSHLPALGPPTARSDWTLSVWLALHLQGTRECGVHVCGGCAPLSLGSLALTLWDSVPPPPPQFHVLMMCRLPQSCLPPL